MTDQYEDHLRESAPCSSRFDGFDRGDINDLEYSNDPAMFDGYWEDIEF